MSSLGFPSLTRLRPKPAAAAFEFDRYVSLTHDYKSLLTSYVAVSSRPSGYVRVMAFLFRFCFV